jgi:hypothetical protein
MGRKGGSKPGERRGGRQKGTGNKSNAEIKALIDSRCDMGEMIDKLVEMSGRNPRAIEILLAYRYGKPKEFHEISSNEFKVIFEHIVVK